MTKFAAVGAAVLLLAACGSADSSESVGEAFTDPEGEYLVEVDPAWETAHGSVGEGVEVWLVGNFEDGFTANLNVATQPAQGLDLERYTAVSIENAPSVMEDFELLASERVDNDASELAIIEWTGTQGGRSLHFLQTYLVHDDRAVVATFTAPTERFAAARAEVEPHLLTLRPPPT